MYIDWFFLSVVVFSVPVAALVFVVCAKWVHDFRERRYRYLRLRVGMYGSFRRTQT